MRNIIFITSCLSFGGAEKMLSFVAESLAKRQHNVTIINLNRIQNYSDYERIVPGVVIETVPKPLKNSFKVFYYIKSIRRIAKAKNADCIIGFTMMPNFYASVVGKLLNITSIISERGNPYQTVTDSFKDKIVMHFINRANGGVFQTDGARAFYSKDLQRRGKVIPNPIFISDQLPEIPWKERNKTVVYVGRLDNRQKRLDVLLKSFAQFHLSHPEYRLRLFGKGADEQLIKQWCNELGIRENVDFMGLTTHPMKDMANDRIFIITSDYEGISNSLLEAMAVGLPCVSTDHEPGGARLLITDHVNGLLAPTGDVNALAKALEEFADNDVLAQKCGNNAKDVINRFAPSRITDMWDNYIDTVCRP